MREPSTGLGLAGEQAAGEGHVGNDADAELLGGGQDFELGVAAEEAVHALLGDDADVAALPGGGLVLGEAPAGEVAGADVEDVALELEPLERAPELFGGDVAVDVVDLVEVDAVGLQAAQRLGYVHADLVVGDAALLVGAGLVHAAVDLGGEHDLVAAVTALGKPAADDLFRVAGGIAVDVGGVPEVDAHFEGAVHDGEGFFFVAAAAEVHRAEADLADLDVGAAEIGVFHGVMGPFDGALVLG